MLSFFLFQAIGFKGEVTLIYLTQSLTAAALAMHKVLSYNWVFVEGQICFISVIMSSVLFQVYEHLC